ncbi:MAG: hypothetical protein K1563_18180 [Candidatus Thiodiazotropha sp. (ex. Lucinisca nassula)]|nr:hypothetical protein [Candidatus Thiodiazotropha sp. (ex. Lucinisca nassula)]PUB84405.1 MAG: hypothetical protein DBP02_08915 [gamma proteobacterium symbiont of Ctena orbiculata]
MGQRSEISVPTLERGNEKKLVTELGDLRQVMAIDDIRSDQRITLVKRGELVDSSKYDRLVGHKLLRPLDFSLAVENRITAEKLMRDGKRLLHDEPELEQAIDRRFIQRDLLTPLGTVPLEPQLAFKLTVCRECCIDRYSRSHAPAWECIRNVGQQSEISIPTLERGNEKIFVFIRGLFKLFASIRGYFYNNQWQGEVSKQL